MRQDMDILERLKKRVAELEDKLDRVLDDTQRLRCENQALADEVKGEFSEEVSAPTQYGSYFAAVVTYLLIYQLEPFGRCAEEIEAFFGIKVSQGTLAIIAILAITTRSSINVKRD